MKKVLIISLEALIILSLFLTLYGVYCNNALTVARYSVENNKNDATIRIVVISDLHSKEFGKNNTRLISQVKKENPDIIAVCGDMVNEDDNDFKQLELLFSALPKIAPTYFTYGNHELVLKEDYDFEKLAEMTGVTLLDNTLVNIENGDNSIVLGGLSDFPYYEFFKPEFDTQERYLWEDMIDKSKNNFTILLHHQPEYMPAICGDSGIDLILCGHTHGGQINLPIFGGLSAPNQGLFPKYDRGLFEIGKTKIIISAGLGNTSSIPRYGNPPEITVIDIT